MSIYKKISYKLAICLALSISSNNLFAADSGSLWQRFTQLFDRNIGGSLYEPCGKTRIIQLPAVDVGDCVLAPKIDPHNHTITRFTGPTYCDSQTTSLIYGMGRKGYREERHSLKVKCNVSCLDISTDQVSILRIDTQELQTLASRETECQQTAKKQYENGHRDNSVKGLTETRKLAGSRCVDSDLDPTIYTVDILTQGSKKYCVVASNAQVLLTPLAERKAATERRRNLFLATSALAGVGGMVWYFRAALADQAEKATPYLSDLSSSLRNLKK